MKTIQKLPESSTSVLNFPKNFNVARDC